MMMQSGLACEWGKSGVVMQSGLACEWGEVPMESAAWQLAVITQSVSCGPAMMQTLSSPNAQ